MIGRLISICVRLSNSPWFAVASVIVMLIQLIAVGYIVTLAYGDYQECRERLSACHSEAPR